MAVQGRIQKLEERHRELDERITQAEKQPSQDSTLIRELKRQKLHLKEQIIELQSAKD